MDGSREDLVSVVVPVYKVEEYLRECLDSIINQTYKNLEIILVDDGSPDKCGEICEEYARNDSRITVYHKENGGLSDARNYGIARSHGEFLTFVDSDDIIKPNFVETLMGLIHKYDADIATAPYMRFSKFTEWGGGGVSCNYCLPMQEALLRIAYQRDGADTSASSRIYRKELFDGVSFPFGMYYEDLATTFRVIIKSRKIAVTDEYLYGYRMREDSIMHTKYSPKMLSCIPVTRQLYKEITEKYPELEAAAASRAFSMNRCIYLTLPRNNKEERMQVWAEMKKYRRSIIFDSRARKRERIAALLSYLGAGAFHLFSGLYRRRRKMV